MPVPDFQTLMLPTLKSFAGGRTSVSECLSDIVAEFGISEQEAEELIPSGRLTVLASRAHWARTYLSKAGLLRSPKRNQHEITERGRTLLASNPPRIDMKVLAKFTEFSDWRDAGRADPALSTEIPLAQEKAFVSTPEEALEKLAREIENRVVSELLETLVATSPAKFEAIVIDLLSAMGFGGGRREMAQQVGRSGDGGIDGVIKEDALGLDAIYIQAKRYSPENKVGRPDIQRFVGSLTGEGATKGVFVTTSGFSKEAHEFLNRVNQRIVLIDGDRLARLLISHGVGVRTEQTYVIRRIDDEYFDVN